ncbi:MAG TPA: diguanylate cyclase [Methylomirabilota bacterium]|nr:diguanylate cyclase [Methylomirabilota bacterium]
MDTTAVTVNYLLYVVLPLWLAAGIADWFCHRASRIATTSGAKESVIHLLMLGEAGIATLLGLFLEIDALVIAAMIACFLAHEVTAHWDLRYAVSHRTVTPAEQHVHNYLGAIPFMALSFIIVLHWPQFLALFGAGPERADFSIALKRTPLPTGYVATLLACIALFDVLPYIEELWRGLTANRGRLVPRNPSR